ncbi:ATP-grasp domain-containing protein, partial [Candidatus Babeliales bacterium]|nr:ATP-grasp domain-containing protein [Candidatus Babeliales bacterium]
VTQIILESGSNFYDYDQKYMPGRASKITPAKCSTKNQDRISKLCESVSKILGFSTISRIDGFLKKDGTIVIIDPNTVSGMGPSSFLFDQAQKAGMSHTDLISTMIESELKHYNIPLPSTTLEKNMTHKKKLRVAVLFGGDSKAEREVSLESGRNVYYKLPPEKYEQIPVFVDKSMKLYKINHELLVKNATCDLVLGLKPEMKLGWSDLPKICDFAFLALHGGKGENGCVQGTLEMLGLPYNGPGVLTSSMCMDKFKTNEFLRQQGFDVPKAGTIGKIQWKGWKQSTKKMAIQLQTIKEHIGLPLILKPVNEGCSALVSKIHSIEELKLKLAEFFENRSCDALLEECIIGAELTVGIIGNEKVKAFVPSRSIATNEILSVEEKFLPGAGENQTPADLPESVIKLIQTTVERIYLAIGAQGYARIDCFYQSVQQSKTQKERVIILEINTLPALTPATCLFHQAAEEDIRPEKLLETFIELGLERRKKVQPKKKPNKSILSSQA